MTTDAQIGRTATRVPLRLAPVALLSDEGLAGRVRAGDERAFEVLYRRYQDRLHRYCGSILRQPEDAEEALQSTMLAAFRDLSGAEERPLAVRPWLYRIAHNQCISMLRRRPATPAAPLSGAEPSPAQGPAARLETAERLDLLRQDLLALPADQRGALVMRELGGLSHEQIAGALDESAAGVKQLIYQARMALSGMEDGRRMECPDVRRRLSDGDGRTLRSRGLAAHLRACAGCRSFRELNAARPTHLAALTPVLPLAAAERILAAVVGPSGGLGGGGGGALVAAATTSSALPSVGGGLAAKLAIVAAVTVAGGSVVVVVPAVVDHPAPSAGGPPSARARPSAPPSALGASVVASPTKISPSPPDARERAGAVPPRSPARPAHIAPQPASPSQPQPATSVPVAIPGAQPAIAPGARPANRAPGRGSAAPVAAAGPPTTSAAPEAGVPIATVPVATVPDQARGGAAPTPPSPVPVEVPAAQDPLARTSAPAEPSAPSSDRRAASREVAPVPVPPPANSPASR